MKIITMTLIICLSFLSCQTKKNKIEILPSEAEYLNQSSLDSKIKMIKGEQLFQSNDFKKELQDLRKKYQDKLDRIIEYNLFINEGGTVEKVKLVNTDKFPDLNNLFIKVFNEVQFDTPIKNGKKVKAQIIWEYDIDNYSVMTNGEKDETFDEPPSPKDKIKVNYPDNARKKGIQGKVIIKVAIDENGNVEKTEILKGVDSELDKAALEAIKNIKFNPAKLKGKTVKSEIVIPIVFKLA